MIGTDKKGSQLWTTVHSCDPALSVLVMLGSRNVFHVASALQSIALMQILYTLDCKIGGVFHPGLALGILFTISLRPGSRM